MPSPKSDLKAGSGQVTVALFQALAAHGGKRRAWSAWMAYAEISKSDLAAYLQVDWSAVDKYWRRDSAPDVRIEQLRDFGVPEFLLPAPSGRPARGASGMQKTGEGLV